MKNRHDAGGSPPLGKRILGVLEAHPQGITIGELAMELGIGVGEQIHLNRRIRDLYPKFNIAKRKRGREFLYVLIGPRDEPTDVAPITKTLRAAVLNAARGRCAMCGATVDEDGAKLVVDHRVPRTWGGRTESDNLWALCSVCNEGKRDFFASIDSPEVRAAIVHPSVHVRIGELLKAFAGKPVESSLIEVVAGQEDWQKRLRELRYLGWIIHVSKRKVPSGRMRSSYLLVRSRPWPENPAAVIRKYERSPLA